MKRTTIRTRTKGRFKGQKYPLFASRSAKNLPKIKPKGAGKCITGMASAFKVRVRKPRTKRDAVYRGGMGVHFDARESVDHLPKELDDAKYIRMEQAIEYAEKNLPDVYNDYFRGKISSWELFAYIQRHLKSVEKEQKEHPWASKKTAERIARDHAKKYGR